MTAQEKTPADVVNQSGASMQFVKSAIQLIATYACNTWAASQFGINKGPLPASTLAVQALIATEALP